MVNGTRPEESENEDLEVLIDLNNWQIPFDDPWSADKGWSNWARIKTTEISCLFCPNDLLV